MSGVTGDFIEPVRYALPKSVAPGASVDIPITVKAPRIAGDFYRVTYQMVQEPGVWFAQRTVLDAIINPRQHPVTILFEIE